jgi:LysR family glycine cleavage system transcriptional activator
LGLTHGAISHRIAELQAQIGVQLFRRNGNRMEPTPRGHALLARVRHALQLLEQAFDTTRRRTKKSRLSLSVLPALASHWLIARLGGFRAEHPEIEIDLEAASVLVEIGAGNIDVAVRFGPGDWPDLQSMKLAPEVLFPVCAGEYRERIGISSLEDIARCTLLRHPWQSWGPWLQGAGLEIHEPTQGPSYSDAGLLLQAAVAGDGVALARGLLAYDDLRAGRLVRLFDIEVADAYSYYVVWRQAGKTKDSSIATFVQWLVRTILAQT